METVKKDSPEKTTTKVAFILLILAVVVWGAIILNGKVGLKDMTQDIATQLLLGIGVVTILIERSIEIILKVWRGEGRSEKDLALQTAKEDLEKGIDGKIEGDELALLENNKRTTESNLKQYRLDTGVLAIRLSFITGIILSLAGFRVLENLYNPSTLLVGWQPLLFKGIDILLTAGLIAGGSKGLHSLTQTFGDFFDAQRRISQKRGKATGRNT